MDILYDMGVSKLSAKDFLKVNYSFKWNYSSDLTIKSYVVLINIIEYVVSSVN